MTHGVMERKRENYTKFTVTRRERTQRSTNTKPMGEKDLSKKNESGEKW